MMGKSGKIGGGHGMADSDDIMSKRMDMMRMMMQGRMGMPERAIAMSPSLQRRLFAAMAAGQACGRSLLQQAIAHGSWTCAKRVRLEPWCKFVESGQAREQKIMDIGRHENLVRELHFPPRPEVVTVLTEEAASEHPNLARICGIVKADVALAGAMLKAVNSPVFARSRKVTSIDQAIDLLGVRNVKSIATGLVLRGAVGSSPGPSMVRFWDSAEKVALISAHIARGLRGTNVEEVYTYGLFHDCGIPMLMQRFPNYKDALIQANGNEALSFTATEEAGVGTHHAVVGYFLARSWHLPEPITNAILLHHEWDVFEQEGLAEQTLDLVAIGHTAQHVHHQMSRGTRDLEWERFGDLSLAHLGFSNEEFLDISEDARSVVKAT